jgi:hypothetical protein
MISRAIILVSLTLVACSSGGTPGRPGTGGSSSGGSGGHGGAGAGGTGGGAGAGSGGAAGSTGCQADAAAVSCFVHGSWQIDNLSPCFFTVTDADGGMSQGAISTVQSGQQFQCPTDVTAAPTDSWSTDALTTDCAGHYTLCYTLKTGSAASPQPNDCVVAQACAENDYLTANQLQPWPDLPGWLATGSQTACAKTFTESGGYGEKSVSGTATGCGQITKLLGTVSYCPLSCSGPNPPAACASCASGASDGGF